MILIIPYVIINLLKLILLLNEKYLKNKIKDLIFIIIHYLNICSNFYNIFL